MIKKLKETKESLNRVHKLKSRQRRIFLITPCYLGGTYHDQMTTERSRSTVLTRSAACPLVAFLLAVAARYFVLFSSLCSHTFQMLESVLLLQNLHKALLASMG